MGAEFSSEFKINFYRKALELFSLSKIISENLICDLAILKQKGQENQSIYLSGDIVRQSSYFGPEIIKAEEEALYDQKYKHAKALKIMTKKLQLTCQKLESCNSRGKDFIPLLKTEIIKFKRLQKTWVLTL
jgi:hypothetical protein